MPDASMHLLVDGQSLQIDSSRRRGIGRYTRNLLRELTNVPGLRVEAAFNAALPPPDQEDLAAAPAIWFEPLLPLDPPADDANARYFAEWLSAKASDAVLLPSLFETQAVVPKFGVVKPPLVAAVIYDLIPLQFHQYYLRNAGGRRFYGERLRRLLACDLALAISEATRRDTIRLLRWPADRVVAILGAAEPLPVLAPSEHERQVMLRSLQIDRPFFLYVGGYDRRKNVTGAIAGFAKLPAAVRADYQLVVVCALDARQRLALDRVATRFGLAGELRLTGFVDDGVLDTLYRACRMTIFPSYYEGLGLPLLEALARGAPVVASQFSAIPEFAGPGARLIDPSSPTSLAAAVQAVLAEPYEARASERRRFAASFQWPTVAARAADALRMAPRQPARRRDGRIRVAWVSPLPPTRSGIADYSAALLERMPADLDISLVIGPEATVEPRLAGRFNALRGDEAVARHEREPFDLFVYHLGNSDMHVYALDLMRRHTGLTVLHDVHLGGLAMQASRVGAWLGRLSDSLGEDAAIDSTPVAIDSEHRRVAEMAQILRPLLMRSDAVVVDSGWNWARVRESRPVPVFRIPVGVSSTAVWTRREACRTLGLDENAFIVVALAAVSETRDLEQLIQSVATLPPRMLTRTELLVVGQAAESDLAACTERARQCGIGDRLRFVGRETRELELFGGAASVCVQLRYPARGETAAAFLRLLGAGAACIVTDAESLGEIPASAALRIDSGTQEREHLSAALIRLYDDPGMAQALRAGAVEFVRREHTIAGAVARYQAAIRLTSVRRARRDGNWADAAVHALNRVGRDDLGADVFGRWAETHVAAVAAQDARE